MAAIVGSIIDGYHDLMDNKSDQRVNDWLLMSGPLPTLAICLTYGYLVKVVGPKFMANRKPYELRNVLIVYNLLQVLFSAWLFYESLMSGWLGSYSLRCQPVDYSNNPQALRMARGCWWYYISKFTEFFDTFFFVLRKKDDQISRLHVIHHGVMPMSVWFGVKFTPGGHSTFFGMLNTFVHIIMYSYYLLAAFGPRFQKYLWWKKYLTVLQMVQFVLVMFHAFQLLFIDCNYPRAFVWWIGMHAIMFYFLFSDFYKQSYKQKAMRKALADEAERKANGKLHQNGHSKENGKQNGYPSENGNGYVRNGNGHMQNGNGHTQNGNGHTQNGNGHTQNSKGHVQNGNAQVDNGETTIYQQPDKFSIPKGYTSSNGDATMRNRAYIDRQDSA